MFLASQIDDLAAFPDQTSLREKLGLCEKEWIVLLGTLRGGHLLARNVVPKFVEPNNFARTKLAVRRAIFDLDKKEGPDILKAVMARLSIPRSTIQGTKRENGWADFVRQECILTKQDAAVLVRPSGNFEKTAEVGCLLH